MRSVLSRYNYFFLFLLIFFISEIIVNPIGDFPLNDDWSYGKAIYYSLTKSYTIGEFGAMTLFTHLAWGALFVKVFGFSFTILRISTFVSVIIGMFFLDKIVFNITANKLLGFLACLVLLFNPLYFNLSNTFMTDVNFNTLFIICSYCALNYFQTRRLSFLIGFFVMACLMVLLRQFGILIPICFTLACFCDKEKTKLSVLLAIVGSVAVYFTLKLYENYLGKILSEYAAYKFSGGVHLTDPDFRKVVMLNFKNRYMVVVLHILIYSAPLSIVFLSSLFKKFSKLALSIFATLSFGLTFVLFSEVRFPFHNVFTNMILGPETFFESIAEHKVHIQRDYFQLVADIIKYCFSAITLLMLILYLAFQVRNKKLALIFKPGIVFLVSFIGVYASMLFLTESYFDRYHIPFITAALILMAFVNRTFSINYKLALVPLFLFLYVSVLGTKDYLSWNRARWQAYTYLKTTIHVNAEKVNGGFEINCLNDFKPTWWSNFITLENYDYLIQFNGTEGFKLLKEYEFQRYFPYMKDKVNIYSKIHSTEQ